MLTKEECERALKNIALSYDAEYVNECNDEFCKAMKNHIKMLENLIEEYFSNPPLEFDELQEREIYYHVYYGWISIRSISDCECILINTLNSDGYKQIEFEEDCFYRKEVQE